jgi:Thioesterase-like superfamily
VTLLPAQSQSYYEPRGQGRYQPTVHATGAWNSGEQHMAPVAGLLTHAIQTHAPRQDLVLSRVSFDILGVMPAIELEVHARTVRRGQTIELIESEMVCDGRTVASARGWRLLTSDTSAIAGSPTHTIDGPEQAQPWPGSDLWAGGYIRSLEFRRLPGHEAGRGRTWIRSKLDLIDGIPTTDLERIMTLTDTANGVSTRVPPHTYAFPNTDLSVHLFRQPVGDWLGLETDVSFGGGGVGLTAACLHDVAGPIGRSAQILTLRSR